jgi:hypothetical protein
MSHVARARGQGRSKRRGEAELLCSGRTAGRGFDQRWTAFSHRVFPIIYFSVASQHVESQRDYDVLVTYRALLSLVHIYV